MKKSKEKRITERIRFDMNKAKPVFVKNHGSVKKAQDQSDLNEQRTPEHIRRDIKPVPFPQSRFIDPRLLVNANSDPSFSVGYNFDDSETSNQEIDYDEVSIPENIVSRRGRYNQEKHYEGSPRVSHNSEESSQAPSNEPTNKFGSSTKHLYYLFIKNEFILSTNFEEQLLSELEKYISSYDLEEEDITVLKRCVIKLGPTILG